MTAERTGIQALSALYDEYFLFFAPREFIEGDDGAATPPSEGAPML